MKPPFANTLDARRHKREALSLERQALVAEVNGELGIASRLWKRAADEWHEAAVAHLAAAERWLTLSMVLLGVALVAYVVGALA